MKIDISRAAQLLKENNNILILTHCNPDGDTLGCGFGLCRALLKMGKKARVVNSDKIPKKYNYLYENMEQLDFEENFVVAVDMATQILLGEKLSEYAEKIDLTIDHHGTNTLFAKETVLDDTAGAACELVYEVIRELGVELDANIANCIYTGLSTDTGCFKYANATSRTYIYGAKMIEAGAMSADINRIMFDTKTRTFARLERLALDSLKMYFDERCAIVKVTQEMLEISGSDDSEVEGITALPRQIEGVLVGITIKEKKDGTCKASVRSRDGFSAAELCQALGGGGHLQAAACSFDISVEEAEMALVKQIEKMLG